MPYSDNGFPGALTLSSHPRIPPAGRNILDHQSAPRCAIFLDGATPATVTPWDYIADVASGQRQHLS